jgi:hypothetical protein
VLALVGPVGADEPASGHLEALAAAAKDGGDPTRLRDEAHVPGGLLVTTAPGRSAAALDGVRARLTGARVQPVTDRVASVQVAPGSERSAARALAALPGVVAVERDRLRRIQRAPSDPSYPQQWAHQQARMEGAWALQTGSRNVRVAVIDTGMQGAHPDLAANIVESQVSTADGRVTITGTRVDNDPCQIGHGTAVAGVVGAVGDNGFAVAGVAWEVSLVDISVASPAVGCGFLSDSAILAGINHAVNGPAGPVDVITLSLGAPEASCPLAYRTAIDDARANDVVLVAAAGNHEQEAPGFPSVPASCNGVLSVGATDASGQVASYSVRNEWVDVVAPGGSEGTGPSQEILTLSHAYPLETTLTEVGTSFAAPYVAGLVALLRAERDLHPDEVQSVFQQTSLSSGLVQGDAALELAASGEEIPPPEPGPDFPDGGMGSGVAPPPVEPEVYRVWNGASPTTAIGQAAAVSDAVYFDDEARHAVIARDDDFADALAGSALGWGIGPLLFTQRTGPLAGPTRAELQRVLPHGSTVYLLGGTAALPDTLDDELRALGYQPRRLFGQTREGTAAAVADEVIRLGQLRVSAVLLARANEWPDAVTGGSIAAWYGTPVLLTPTGFLHPATAEMLSRLRPQVLYALGGTAALSEAVVAAAGDAAGVPPELRVRLAGPTRDGTAVAIADELEELMAVLEERLPTFAVAVNVRRADGFAHALSASLIPGFFGAVFVPVEGSGGTLLTPEARDYVRGFGIDGVVIGGPDLVADHVHADLEDLLRR